MNDQLHEDAVKYLLQRQRNATETNAKGVVKSYNQRRKQATAELQSILIKIRECFRQGESVGGYTSWTDWASHQSVTIKQLQRIISGTPQKRHDVVLKAGMTVTVDDAKVVLTQSLLNILSGTVLKRTAKKVKKVKTVACKLCGYKKCQCAEIQASPACNQADEPVTVPTKKVAAKRTKKLPQTAHFRIESNGRKGGAQGYNIVSKEDGALVWRGDARGFGSFGTSNLDYAKLELKDQEYSFIAQQEGAAEDIEIGHTCDHGEYYHNAEGDFQEADPHSINPDCEKCVAAKATPIVQEAAVS